MRFRHQVLAVVVTVACGLAAWAGPASANTATARATGASADSPAVAALRQQIRELDAKQWAKVYSHLHPAQKVLVPQAQYVQCAVAANAPPFSITKVISVKPSTTKTLIPGTTTRSGSTVVIVNLKSAQESGKTKFQEFKVNGKWYFAVNNIDGYAEGGCPT